MEPIAPLEKRLGVKFNNEALLVRAVTHGSYLNEHPDEVAADNERLEFLGDAVLDFVVGSYLYRRFPELAEGDLTSLRAALVRSETLADFARTLELGQHMRLGLGEAENGGRERTATLCAGFEAVVGAIYLDQGLRPVTRLVDALVEPALHRIRSEALHKDAKSEFQVWAQGRFNVTPSYRVIDSTGPDHDKVFTVEVRLQDERWGEGTGRSKQRAAQAAARQALTRAQEMERSADP